MFYDRQAQNVISKYLMKENDAIQAHTIFTLKNIIPSTLSTLLSEGAQVYLEGMFGTENGQISQSQAR